MAINKRRMAGIYTHILQSASVQKKLLAVLIDPEKMPSMADISPYLVGVDYLLVGGSTGEKAQDCVWQLRKCCSCPIILFPGNVLQFTPDADAIFFLSLLTARSAGVLIEPHVQIAPVIRQSGIESIPMGYILIDGGRQSSVEKATGSHPLPADDVPAIVNTAIAGELLGKRLIYLEAGSGAKVPIGAQVITSVKKQIAVPLIVGGGITSVEAMLSAFRAGADMVVIGNHFENNFKEIPYFVEQKNHYNG